MSRSPLAVRLLRTPLNVPRPGWLSGAEFRCGASRKQPTLSSNAELRIAVPGSGEVSALFLRGRDARNLLVLGHGAGAGMAHPFMEALAQELSGQGVATLRYQFPYMEERRKVPDSPATLIATVRAAVRAAQETAPDLPLIAGGKSMGGRMTSQAAAEAPLAGVHGLVFFGFPLHPPKRPSTKRADHLFRVTVPMLFLQGARDTLAELPLLRPICDRLGALATLRIFDTADHSFHVLKRAGKSDADTLHEISQAVSGWTGKLHVKTVA